MKGNIATKVFFAIAVCSVLLFSCQKESIEPAKTEYIAVFGDIQYNTRNTNDIIYYKNSLKWILDEQKNGRAFKCVLHTGDLTMSNATNQWQMFSSSIQELSQTIPCYSMIGDHDYTWYDGLHINDRGQTKFNDYIQYPLSYANVVSWFEPGRMENVVVRNTVQGQRLDFLILEFGPRDEIVAWADGYVKSHPNDKFILMTHEYLESGGGRRVDNLKCALRLENTTYNTPEQLWHNLIKCNDNIICVLCGHVGGLYALTVDTNDFGRAIPQIQHNIQSSEYRYDNWLMLWEFPIASDKANVYMYNTNTGQYYDGKTSLFRFKYRDAN